MDKDMAHIYNGLLAIKRNKIRSFVEMWMDLESVIQSEVRNGIFPVITVNKGCHSHQ